MVCRGIKTKDSLLEGPELDAAMATPFRSACMRLAYLAMDRPEIQYTAKEIARAMANPTEAAWTALKRCVRYLIGKPRMVTVFRRQKPTNGVLGMSDSGTGLVAPNNANPAHVCLWYTDDTCLWPPAVHNRWWPFPRRKPSTTHW